MGSNCTSMGYLLVEKRNFRFKVNNEDRCEIIVKEQGGQNESRYEIKVTSEQLRLNHELRTTISRFPEDKKLILCLGLTAPYAKYAKQPKCCILILTGILFQTRCALFSLPSAPLFSLVLFSCL